MMYGWYQKVKERLKIVKRQKDAVKIYDLIDELRAGEGDSVTIFCENSSFHGPNQKIAVNGEWTSWEDQDFDGDTLVDCLEEAVAAMIDSKK